MFIEIPFTNFHGNSSNGRHAATCGRLDGQTDVWTDGRTDKRR